MPDPVVVTETWTGADSDPWDSTTWPIQREDQSLGSPGSASILGNKGRMQCGPADNRFICFTEPEMANFEVTFKLSRPTVGQIVTAQLGYRIVNNFASGHPDGYSLTVDPFQGNIGIARMESNVYTGITGGSSTGNSLDDAVERWFRVRVKGSDHRARWWEVGDSEPSTWNIIGTDSTFTTGRSFLGLYNFGVGSSADIRWDDFTMTEILPPDPGFRIGTTETVAIYLGTEPVVAAYLGTTEIPVPEVTP